MGCWVTGCWVEKFSGNMALSGRALGSMVLGSRALGNTALGSRMLGSMVLVSMVFGNEALGNTPLGSRVLGRALPRSHVALFNFTSWKMSPQPSVPKGTLPHQLPTGRGLALACVRTEGILGIVHHQKQGFCTQSPLHWVFIIVNMESLCLLWLAVPFKTKQHILHLNISPVSKLRFCAKISQIKSNF